MKTDELFSLYKNLENDIANLSKLNKSTDKFGLKRINHFLNLLGNPHQCYKSIHVTGTSGKGSTATMIASILGSEGFKTGLNISPSVQILNERFQINNKIIPTSKIRKTFDEMMPIIQDSGKHSEYGALTAFEIFASLAFMLFAKENIDVAIVEVGIGGMKDATNILDSQISVITNIGLDHTEILGNSVEEIAKHKIGVIKQEQIVISGVRQLSLQKMIAGYGASMKATFRQLGKDFQWKLCENKEQLSIAFQDKSFKGIGLNMAGEFQFDNAACATAASVAFKKDLSEKSVQNGLKGSFLPGRMEVVHRNPLVILDGAHNVDKISASTDAIIKSYTFDRKIVIFSIKSDKLYREILQYIVEGTSILILTSFKTKEGHRKPLETDILALEVRQIEPSLEIHFIHEPQSAMRFALSRARENDLIWVTGSFHLVGEIRNLWYPSYELLSQAEQ